MLICWISGKCMDKKGRKQGTFSQKYPRLNMIVALALVLMMGTGLYVIICYIANEIKQAIYWVTGMASKMDAVVIVALITGTVSIVGVIDY